MSRQFWNEGLAIATADGTAVANTATETAIFSAVTIPANYLQDSRTLKIRAIGKLSNTATPTIRFRLRFGTATGGVVLADTGALTFAGAVTANSVWEVDLLLTTRSNGSSATVECNGRALVPLTTSSALPTANMMTSAGASAPAVSTIDATADTALNLTCTWGSASASNTLTGVNFILESVN